MKPDYLPLLQEINIKINELRQNNLTEEEIEEAINDLEKIKLELSESKIEIYFLSFLPVNFYFFYKKVHARLRI